MQRGMATVDWWCLLGTSASEENLCEAGIRFAPQA